VTENAVQSRQAGMSGAQLRGICSCDVGKRLQESEGLSQFSTLDAAHSQSIRCERECALMCTYCVLALCEGFTRNSGKCSSVKNGVCV
jgi:hypothetical protein